MSEPDRRPSPPVVADDGEAALLGAPARAEAPATRLMNKNFFLLWQGQFVSQLGTQAFTIALMFWVKHATESASLLGLLMMAAALPTTLVGPVGGVLADRYSRRAIIIYGDLVRGVAVMTLALILYTRPDATVLVIAWLLGVSILTGIADGLFRPAVVAAIPDLVPDEKVEAANSLNKITVDGSTLLGQATGGFLFSLLGPAALFLLDAVTYLFSAASECFIRIPQTLPDSTGGFRERLGQVGRDLKTGLAYVWRTPGTRGLLLLMPLFNSALGVIIVLFPFYVEDFLGRGPTWFGWLVGFFGGGALLGSVLAGAVRLPGAVRARVVPASAVAYALAAMSLGWIVDAQLALVAVTVAGAMNGFMNVHVVTALQRSTPSELRGRVFGAMETLVLGLTPIAMGLTGIVTDLTGRNVPAVFIGCGAFMGLLALLLGTSRPVRAFLAAERRVDTPEATDEAPPSAE